MSREHVSTQLPENRTIGAGNPTCDLSAEGGHEFYCGSEIRKKRETSENVNPNLNVSLFDLTNSSTLLPDALFLAAVGKCDLVQSFVAIGNGAH